LLLAAVITAGLVALREPAQEAVLVVDWPAGEREGARLRIDQTPEEDLTLTPEWRPLEKAPESPKSDLLAGGPGKEAPRPENGTPAGEAPAARRDSEAIPESVVERGKAAGQERATSAATAEALAAAEAGEARYAEALRPAQGKIAAWDFRGAEAVLAEIQFEEESLVDRLATRRDEVRRLASLKARMIQKINAADPPLRKVDLRIRGINGDVVEADEQGITAKLASGKTEECPWHDLGEKATGPLLQLVVDRTSADDWLSAGVFALTFHDVGSAEKHFAKAESLGLDIGPYLAPLASGGLAQAWQLLQQQKFADARTVLADLEAKYATTPWFASHKTTFEAARARARAGIEEVEAEKLYAQAARLFQERKYFDLKPLTEELRARYP
jgi:hypothetical protein